jgi:hypothetical protein
MSTTLSRPSPRQEEKSWNRALKRLGQVLVSESFPSQLLWADEMELALIQVEKALRAHQTASQAQGGLIADVDEIRPTLARQIDEIGRDQEDLLKQVIALREKVGRALLFLWASKKKGEGATVDMAGMGKEAEELLNALQQEKEKEIQLVQESINMDIGVGD